jgi:4-amino-4-deoxy-L-arabinose transferase-like glycosyltransferase
MRLAAGQNIYRPDISSPPYTISNYPPLYVLSLVPSVWLFGPNFWAGRAISMLCALASGTFLALIIYAHTRDRIAAVTTGMLFLAIPYVVHWSPLLRIDMLALACSTGGLYLLARWPTRPSTPASRMRWPRRWRLSSGC